MWGREESFGMDIYKAFLRPLLFRLDPELAHNIAKAVLQRPILGRLFGDKARFVQDDRLTVYLEELKIPNPVGLGAGFDKDGDMLDSLSRFGFFSSSVSGFRTVVIGIRPTNSGMTPNLIRSSG